MKLLIATLSVWCIVALSALPAGAVVFARSGQKVMLPVRGDYKSDQGPLALWAFGRSWAKQTEVKDGKAEFTAPTVRVPVVYKMKSGRDEHCELVVYPDRPITWDKDTEFVAVSASDWFKTWAKAVDMPVKYEDYLPRIDGSEPRSWSHKKHRLVLLDKPYTKSAFDLGWAIALANESNVLWLSENWFDTNVVAVLKMNLSPKLMMGPLAELQNHNWPSPPQFDHQILCVLNRQTWIDGPSYPWVEEIRMSEKGKEHLRVVWSYLPWPKQLGRNEVADMLFIRLLTEAAQGAKDRRPLNSGWCLLYPPAKGIKAEERPVLAAAMKSAETASPDIRAYVLDLRGKVSPPDDLFKTMPGLATIEPRIGKEPSLLILGDHPILETWKWLKADRTNHRSPQPGVLWWPEQTLPPAMESQLRLMQLFTEWNISIGNTFWGDK